MKKRPVVLSLLALALATSAACGGSSSSSSPGYFITMSGLNFSPANLEAPAGATITAVNQSTMPHSVTQEVTLDGFTPGAPAGTTPFDTGLFPAGSRTFTLPTGLADGTVLYYYCTTHTSQMLPSSGRITIRAAAPPVSPPGGSGGGY
jgi:plastocyanin